MYQAVPAHWQVTKLPHARKVRMTAPYAKRGTIMVISRRKFCVGMGSTFMMPVTGLLSGAAFAEAAQAARAEAADEPQTKS